MHVKSIKISMLVVYHQSEALPRTAAGENTEVTLAKGKSSRLTHSTARRMDQTHARGRKSQPKDAAEVAAPKTLAERVYQQLKRDIVRGVFQSGEAINEKILARRYQSSRTPVREAVMRLQQETLLRLVSNKGYFVSHLTIQELNEMYEYRAEVEAFSAGLAARRWTNHSLMEKLASLAQMQYRMQDRASYERFIEADTEFHVGIAQLTKNRLLVRTVAEVRCQMERIMFAAIDIGYYGEAPVREHSKIIDAIRSHDIRAARQRMYDHIVGSKDKVLRLADEASNQY